MSPFFQLLLIALGKRECLDAPLDAEQWEAVFELAKKQAVLGIVGHAVLNLPADQLPPRPIKVRFALVVEKIGMINSKMNEKAALISTQTRELGLESCVLKGQGVASLYPLPSLRQSGDIDLWVKGDYRHTLDVVGRRWKLGSVFYHHVDIRPFGDKTEVEVHFTPNWMNSPFTNRKLQAYFHKMQDAQFASFRDELGFAMPEAGFDCVFSAVHIFRHLLFEGIGIRQVMDYYHILLSSSVLDREAAFAELKALGLERFTGALMYVLQNFFELDDGYLLCPADPTYGEFLKEEILLSGNFGKYDERFSRIRKSDGLMKKAIKRIRRLPRFLLIAPSEVLWAPFFKAWQHIWKAVNRF